jgi:hypothetical protein
MSFMSFDDADLDQYVTIELTLRQAVYISNIMSLYIESGLAADAADLLEAYGSIFSSIEEFGNINTEDQE